MNHDHHDHHHESTSVDTFPTDVDGLAPARAPAELEHGDGDSVELRIAPVAKTIGEATVRMLAFNGSVPGPTLRVPQGSELDVVVRNDGDYETTVHWHGLRLDNRYDGTHETQAPIEVGGSFTYRISFPDPGAYWYHPHVREDYGQELGLYGQIIVVPSEADYWPPVHRELALTLDDLLLEDGKIAPFHRDETTYAAMGRYGNVLLVAGDTDTRFDAASGDVVRLFLTNTANTRVFDVRLPGARMKLVGGDSGRVEREVFVDSIVLAPSERAVIDVRFDGPGTFALEHHSTAGVSTLATFDVAGESASPQVARAFETLRSNDEWRAVRERVGPYLDAEPAKTIAFVAEMDVAVPEGAATYACPMHPHVVSDKPGRCPECGMKLLPQVAAGDRHDDHGHHEHEQHHGAHGDHAHGNTADGIEWEDDMVEVNRDTTSGTMRWKIVERDTGATGHEIDWRFRVGDLVKVRLVNEMDSDHPMHHPFHVHGAGRFLVLARGDEAETNLVWKDTVLVRTGETVDILLELTNPGRWMAHCHIAEHHESGMMFSFTVDPTG